MQKILPFLLFLTAPFSAIAQENIADPWQLGMVNPASPVMEQLFTLHHWLLITITVISIFVLVLLAYICLRFRASANPNPSKVTHNTKLEIIWTTIPILILIAICVPSVKMHYFMDVVEKPEMTLKVVGRQWYWSYEYPDHGGIAFDSYIKQEKDLQAGEPRLLTVDNEVVVPVDTTIRVNVTGADVIHAWAMPSFGVKVDAVPGRLNETWFKATREGIFRGQCSELCGKDHGFMPIVIRVVSKEAFQLWVEEAKKKFADSSSQSTTHLAQLQ